MQQEGGLQAAGGAGGWQSWAAAAAAGSSEDGGHHPCSSLDPLYSGWSFQCQRKGTQKAAHLANALPKARVQVWVCRYTNDKLQIADLTCRARLRFPVL